MNSISFFIYATIEQTVHKCIFYYITFSDFCPIFRFILAENFQIFRMAISFARWIKSASELETTFSILIHIYPEYVLAVVFVFSILILNCGITWPYGETLTESCLKLKFISRFVLILPHNLIKMFFRFSKVEEIHSLAYLHVFLYL